MPSSRSLHLVHVACSLCGSNDPQPIAVGEDFECRTSDDTFLMVRCRVCDLLYLDPRPAESEVERISQASVRNRALPERDGFVRRASRRLQARRLLRACRNLPSDARVLDVGCGDGFHLDLLREFGPPGYRLEGVDSGSIARTTLETAAYDLALAVRSLQQSDDPRALLGRIAEMLRPGGVLVVLTDNAGSPASRLFANRYWSGYRFPHHRAVFTLATISQLAASSGLQILSTATAISPFGWIDSIRNALLDVRAPEWLVERFSTKATLTLALFTIVDALARSAGGGSLLRVHLRRPQT